MFFVVIAPDIYFHSRNATLTDKTKRAVSTVSVKKGVLLKLSLLILLSSATPLFVGAMIQLHATTLIRRPVHRCTKIPRNEGLLLYLYATVNLARKNVVLF
jgi:hypothetical protein